MGGARSIRDAEFRPDAGCRTGMRGLGFSGEKGERARPASVAPFVVSHARIQLYSHLLSIHQHSFPALCIGSKFRIPHSTRHSHLVSPLAPAVSEQSAPPPRSTPSTLPPSTGSWCI